MVLHKRVETILEFDKIKNLLMEKAVSSMARELILSLGPSGDEDQVRRWQQETKEGSAILKSGLNMPLSGLRDIRTPLRLAKVGAVLAPKDLLEVASCMRTSRLIKKLWGEKGLEDCDIVDGIAENLHSFLSIEEKIEKAIVGEEEIADDASPRLLSIRRQKKSLSKNIRDKLNDIINSPHYQKALQEPIVTMRKDRYVVPVRQEFKGSVSGVVHDQSASGSTLYIEPMAVVNMNNELRQLEVEEGREIERILWEFSAKIQENHDFIYTTLVGLTQLDFIMAKAAYALDIRGVEPFLNNRGFINIIKGRHPLLTGHVVPIDVLLGEEYSTLVITGPNTGGKTVSLKTVGLFTLMAQSGLQVPALEGTELSIFEGIYADIGDEQSIEQSLSTFSAHMKNIREIIEQASSRSLVLLDELGSGTDPTEGAALAMAILDYFHEKGTRVMATTHYSELKTYAYSRPGIENASVEFDVKTLSPTYKLTIGLPGKSNAFEIAQRLGLKAEIIETARRFIADDSLKLEDLLKHIETERIKAQEDSEEIRSLKRTYQRKLEQLEEEREKTRMQRDKILDKAKEKARTLLEKLERESDEVIDELKEAAEIHGAGVQDRAIERAKTWLREAKREFSKSQGATLVEKARQKQQGPLKPGEAVHIAGLNQEGYILEVDETAKSAQVQVGIMKINVPLDSLNKIKSDDVKDQKAKYTSIGLAKLKSFSKEIDLRGNTLEEALYKVDKYLDDAQVAGVSEVTIIHGKGTGVLRRGIDDMLKTRPGIQGHRPGGHDEGGIGVTVVELR